MPAHDARRNRISVLLLVSTWLLVRFTAAQTPIFETPLSPRTASYNINVILDDQARHLDGHLVLSWTNPSGDRVGDLQFHLYTNAFRNNKSTFIRESFLDETGGSQSEPDPSPFEKDIGWGGMNISRMEVNGLDTTERITFIQPDDGNADDRTVVRVALPAPIAPHATAKIEIDFEVQLPQCRIRMGWWQEGFFMLAHWFPKIGVYEPPGMRFVPSDASSGQWNCHQFHDATEFYSDFGVYNVRITLPEKYVVGATGLIISEHSNGDGTKTIVVHAEDVHEFAWVADAQFRERQDSWRNDTAGQNVSIRLLYQPDHEAVVDKYINSIKQTLGHVERWLGPGAYPYPNITVVDPRSGSGAVGMEYPTLITGGASWWAEQLFGDGVRIVEGVTIHEFMHQFWYGIVANNEFEEAWLDEGLTSYSAARISAELFGPRTSWINWWGLTASGIGEARSGYATSLTKYDASIADWTYQTWRAGIGQRMAYKKSNLMLMTLANYLGKDRFDAVMRSYFQKWKFRHPTRNDFVAVANETSGENLNWFFSQVIDQSTALDYAVVSISNVPKEDLDKGILGDALELPAKNKESDSASTSKKEESTDSVEDKVHESTVVFRRMGDVVFPVDTLIEFSDGSIVREKWDGRDRIKTYRFTHTGKVVRAAVDPDQLVPLDVNRLNNSLRIKKNDTLTNKYTLKAFFWIQSLLQTFSLFG